MNFDEATAAVDGFAATVDNPDGHGDGGKIEFRTMGADELGIIMGVQRAGDVVLTRPALLIPRERGYTLWDALPDDEGHIR
jgi:hypothetical protein